jgi:ubiquilin
LWDAAKNIRALRMTGGNVEAAVEIIFSGQAD